MHSKRLQKLLLPVVLAALIAANMVIWTERDNILDWWRLRGYDPPAQIAELAQTTGMTARGIRLFYTNHPALDDRQTFNAMCADYGEETAVLGCYHGRRQGIYIYAVNDPRLSGVLQVTAAHEMLHEAYDRLSGRELKSVQKMLQSYYDSGGVTQDLRDKINSYRAQGADIMNEMHSIFATEVADLPVNLEKYYGRYFTDRKRIVEYNDAYKGEFTRRKQLVSQYDGELAGLKMQIEGNKAWMAQRLDELNGLEKDIEQSVNAHDQQAYSEKVKQYNAIVDAYNARLSATHRMIDEYNGIVSKRNEIATQEQDLQEALDSRYVPTNPQ